MIGLGSGTLLDKPSLGNRMKFILVLGVLSIFWF